MKFKEDFGYKIEKNPLVKQFDRIEDILNKKIVRWGFSYLKKIK